MKPLLQGSTSSVRSAACLLLLLLTAAGCSGPSTEAVDAPPAQPPGWLDELALRPVVDLNPDPNTLELNLEARVSNVELIPGKPTAMWTYDGGVPGPLIRAKVGDRLIVHFKNSLPEPTTIHWHGLRIPAAMDGALSHDQSPIAPGETFDYDFVLPDAGTFWYHPHVNSATQVGNGLYGPLIVDDPAEPDDLGDEAVLVLSDASVDEDGELAPGDAGGDFGTLFGREGDLILVNGRVNPTIHARAGLRQRWRLINAARSRFFELHLPGHDFTRIGGDGGLLETPEVTDSVLVTPAERADVLVEPGRAGGQALTDGLTLLWHAHYRGYGTDFNRPDEDVLRVRFTGDAPARSAELPALSRTIVPIDTTGATQVDISLTISSPEEGPMTMGINGVPFTESSHLPARVGETQVWTVKNTFEFAHPFHLHGFFFQVLDVNGVAPAVREWKDTVNVEVDGQVRFVVKYDDRPGMWMFHCHILDHADAGMMGMVGLTP
jgi:FtsP/CotA-like multicopper oxidase with cupredoxin domain